MNKGEEYVRQRGWRVSEITEGDRMSEQGAAPTMPEDLRRELAHLNFLIEESCTGQATSITRSWAERIAALTLERDTLKAEIAEGNKIYEAVCAKFDGCPHAQQVNVICGCSFDDKDDVCALHAPQLKKALEEAAALKATVERLAAPVSDDEWCDFAEYDEDENGGIPWAERSNVDELIAARASTPPPHPINDDDQRRKDAAWNDRAKARCVCGEMIAWYSGEYLHVAGRSKSCADGRLASPAHFLVGMPPGPARLNNGKCAAQIVDCDCRRCSPDPTTAPLP